MPARKRWRRNPPFALPFATGVALCRHPVSTSGRSATGTSSRPTFTPRTGETSDADIHKLTTTPNDLVAPIHNRMPVLIEPEDYSTWLDRDLQRGDVLHHLLRPYPSEKLATHPVSTKVNNPRYDEADCIVDVGS